ncbi:MAG: hypothetical protein AB4206_00230 [Xenococcaceae cyanobacterium]
MTFFAKQGVMGDRAVPARHDRSSNLTNRIFATKPPTVLYLVAKPNFLSSK